MATAATGRAGRGPEGAGHNYRSEIDLLPHITHNAIMNELAHNGKKKLCRHHGLHE